MGQQIVKLMMVKAWCTSVLHHQTAKHADISTSTEGNNEDAAS